MIQDNLPKGGSGGSEAIDACYESTTALYTHDVGEYIWLKTDEKIYLVTATINRGDAIVYGTNIGDAELSKNSIAGIKNKPGSGGGEGGSGGHTIIDGNGNEMEQETDLQFGTAFNVTDDATNGRTKVDLSSPLPVSNGGTGATGAAAARSNLGITNGHTILNSSGTTMTQQTKLQFGDGLFVSNASGKTVVSAHDPATVYGFHQNFANSDPSTTISYTIPNPQYTVINKSYTPMMTNLANGSVTKGSWGGFLTALGNKPAMVKKNGTLDYFLKPDDYTKRVDGTVSDYNNTSYAGGAFAWINKIYIKEVYASDNESRDVYIAIGNAPDNTFEALGFNDNTNELSGLWLPMGYMDASGRTLVTGTTPIASKTTADEWALIQAFSSRARFLGGPIMNVLRDIEYMLFKSTDIQLSAGYGRCNAYNLGDNQNSYNRVVANSVVDGFYGNGDKKTNNKMFHSQVLGTYGQWLRDPYTLLIGGTLYVSPNYVYNLSGVKNTGVTRATGGWYYATHMEHVDGFGSISKGNAGSTTTGLCDGHYYNASGTRVALRRGNSNSDLLDGPETLYLNAEASHTNWGDGVGVLLLPPAGYNPTA